MRIHNGTNFGYNVYKNQQNRSNHTGTESKQPLASTKVEISERGMEIAKAMKSDQPQRSERLQELKQQIADGTYVVDSQKVAEKLIDFWRKGNQ